MFYFQTNLHRRECVRRLEWKIYFNFTKPFLIHHWFVPWMNRKGHNQFRMLHLFIYISSFQYQTPKWCDWYLLYFESGSTRVRDGEKMCCYGATEPQYFFNLEFYKHLKSLCNLIYFPICKPFKVRKSLSHSNHALRCQWTSNANFSTHVIMPDTAAFNRTAFYGYFFSVLLWGCVFVCHWARILR